MQEQRRRQQRNKEVKNLQMLWNGIEIKNARMNDFEFTKYTFTYIE